MMNLLLNVAPKRGLLTRLVQFDHEFDISKIFLIILAGVFAKCEAELPPASLLELSAEVLAPLQTPLHLFMHGS
jgi:hypothetical protein